MELKEIYKLNPRIVSYKDVRRENLVERRKSKRNDCFDQRRNYSEDSNDKLENQQPVTTSGKENRRDLLMKWKEERKKDQKNTKKPFVVGIVRHNAGSPLFKGVPPLKEVKQIGKTQATRPQASTSQAANPPISGKSGVFCFGKSKPAVHKFKVANSVKKLTVPITPSFMDPTKRGNLASKSKPEVDEVSAARPKRNQKKNEKPKEDIPTEQRRVTRAAAAKGAVKKSPMIKMAIKKVNEPSTSNAGPSKKPKVAFTDDQAQERKTSEVRKVIEGFVLSPLVRVKKELTETIEDQNKDQLEHKMETNDIVCDVNTGKPAQEYYDRLQRETVFLLECCDRWSKPTFTQVVPQETSDEIDSTVGQARLLVRDKFQQFKNLVQRFEEDSKPPVTTDDLDGFWDMMYIQVEKMKQRFDHLSELKSNNWTKNAVEVVVKKKVAVKPKAKPNVKSRFQEFMMKKKLGKSSKDSSDSQNDTAGINLEESQLKTGTPTSTPLKDRMMQQVLDPSRSERRRSSLASASRVLRTSLIAKTLAMSPLVQTGEMSAIGNRKSILNSNCPSSPLTPSATFTGDAKKKVGFGIEDPTERIVSPAPKRIPRTPRFAASRLDLTDDNSDTAPELITESPRFAVSFSNETDDDSITVPKRIPQTPRFVVGSNCETDDEDDSNTVPKRIPRTPRFVVGSNCETDDEDDSNTVPKRIPRTPRFVVSSNCETDDEDDSNTVPKRISRTPRFVVSSNCETDDDTTLTNSNCSDSRRRSSRLRSNIQESPLNSSISLTGGKKMKKKKVGFSTVESIGTLETNDDANVTPGAPNSFKSPNLRRSTRLRSSTPVASNSFVAP